MSSMKVHIFGYGQHGKRITEGLKSGGYNIHILESDGVLIKSAEDRGYIDVDLIDMLDDDVLQGLDIDTDDLIVCVMDDEHLNVFLTLTLRQYHPSTKIYAISDSIHTAKKLEMAGATKVIDLYAVSATRIHNFLSKPVTTKLLADILGDQHEISFREYEIPVGSFLHGLNTDEIDFDLFNLLLIGVIDFERSDNLTFVTEGINHKLDTGDMLVMMGKEFDLNRFSETIKRKSI